MKSTPHLVSVFLLSVSLLTQGHLHAQNRNVRFQHLTLEDGLPQNMVDCMLQDSQGFLWFGTWNGLCRYDGHTFEVFDGKQHASGPLRTNFIHSLAEDVHGNLWIGTKEGLQAYIYDQNAFIAIEGIPGAGAQAFADVRSLVLHRDSVLLVGSDRGLSAFSILGPEGQVRLIRHYPFGSGIGELRGTIVNTILSDFQHNVWVGTDDGITFLPADGVSPRYFRSGESGQGLGSNQILSLFQAEDGEIWIGTEFGLYRYHVAGQRFDQFLSAPGDLQGLVHNTVMDLNEDGQGNLIIATLGGIGLLDRKTGLFVNYQNEFNVEHSLSNDFVNCLLPDDLGNIWIGTERGGVNCFRANQNIIEHFEFKPDDPNSLSHSTVNSVYEDARYLWIGTAGGGLNRYDKSTGRYHVYMHDPGKENSLSSDFVTATHRDRRGRLWVATWGSGLDILNEDMDAFEHHQSGDRPGLVSNFISSVAEDSLGNLWIGTLGGLVRYDLEEDRFETLFDGKSGKRITQVGCLMFDASNDLWVGTRYGLFQVEFGQGNHQPVLTRYEHSTWPGSIGGDYVISMLQDASGGLWFGTYGQGLSRLMVQGDSSWFESYTSADGLSNTIIYGIEEDPGQMLWLSTDYGLSRFDPASGRIRNFYTADGLLNNQYYWSASYKNEAGKLYFGGMNGLDAFYPEWIKEEVSNPRILITDIKLLNESVMPGREYNGVQVLTESPYKAERIELSYKEKVFGIEFSSLNYQEEPGMIRYGYILEGLEKEWNYVPSSRRYASYTNLRPGNYTFKVMASSSNGDFNMAPKEIAIRIAPPFWDTNWFRGLVLLALAGMVVGYIRLRTYTLKRQKMILERQVKERTERINQQNEALSFQAIQLQSNNRELEEKQKLIEGQNQKLENQNKEILSQRDELMSLNRKLKLVSQLKLSFFTNISHEFRTPLTLIIGPLERLLKEHDFQGEVKNSLNVMHRNAQRLLHLINQIMDFRKIEKGRMDLRVTKADVGQFCHSLFRAFEPLAEIKQTAFSYEERELPEEVWFDAGKLENILYNLLSNAFKYTPNGGRVNMEVRGLTLEQSRLKKAGKLLPGDKKVVCIRISDSGIGISQDNLPLVFKRFYRIESEEAFRISGSGIGLALTEELIKTHHGDIHVESKLGEGSVFEIQFPCLKGAYDPQELTERAPEALSVSQQVEILKNELMESTGHPVEPEVASKRDMSMSTVLVVEDSTDLRTFITHRLARSFNVLEADNGLMGLQMADKHSPDIIISDVMMPKMNGLELCARIKGNLGTSHIPVVLLTAKSAIEDQLEGLQTGADDYLAKPFNFELLEAKVRNFVESRRKLRHLFLQSSDFRVDEATTNTKDQKFLEHAIEVVEGQMENSGFGVKQFIEAMGISRSLLHKKLTSLTDQSAADFINHLRMKKARVLLRQSDMNISEVAYAVGYNDPKYFTRLFSRHFGQSPKEFQEVVPS